MLNYIFESEGKTRSEAEQNALNTLRLDASDLKFVTVESPRFGFLGLTARKPAVVRAYPARTDIPIEKIIHGVVQTILKKMGIEARVVGMGDVEGKIYVELESEDSGLLIGKRGTTLDALQFLVNLMVDAEKRANRKIVIDIADYREKREMALIRMGKSTASAVAKTGKARLLEPMNPYERRIIHMALQKDDRVFTRSDGTGTYKRVRVIPMKDRHKYPDVDPDKSDSGSDELD
ncbi:MAG: KH domain-containing protein [Leptospiraceae bacterium]|nr:KH domain-containing protein [Leptospiraceae bacterium]MCP5498524.1 KH domain-containing protein [Leptospiraceae bacterium]